MQPTSPVFKSTPTSDVSYCFAHVPEIYFNPELSLNHTGIFSEPERLDSDKKGEEDDSDASDTIDNMRNHKHSGGLYTVDLDNDDLDDTTDGEGNSSSPDIPLNRHNIAANLLNVAKFGGKGVLKNGRDFGKLFNMETARTLSKYLDLVEVALLRQIITRSPSFFRALDDINSLHSCVSRAAIRVIHIRRQLRHVKDGEVEGDIRIPKLERRRRNEMVLNQKIQSMQR